MNRPLKPRILCVDDDPLFCDLLKRVFMESGEFYVECESNAFRAIHKMRAFKPDVVLLDINMPGQSGFRIAHLMREEAWLRHRPVVFYSGMYDAEEAMYRACIGGPTAFVRKGTPLATVEETVRRMLSERLRPDQASMSGAVRPESDIQPMNAISICRETVLGRC